MNTKAQKTEYEIQKLLQQRDKSVIEKNVKAFQETQVGEIQFSGVEGYMGNDYQESDLLSFYPSGKDQPLAVGFVKETYFKEGKKTHHGFLIYYFTRTDEGWKVRNIAH